MAENGVAAKLDMDTRQVAEFIKCPLLMTEPGIVEQGD